ncbi:MAG: PPC domain-containing DNA-binding protein [Thermodesulfovibrionales bacterium]
MKYQIGRPGRIVVARLEDKDDVLGSITAVAKKENIRAGVVHIVGGMREGSIVVGPEKDVFPPTPVWKKLGESHEVTGFGTIFWQGDEPKVHFHGAFGKKEMVKVGCLRESSETFLVLEAVIVEIEGVDAKRELDPESGMVLLKV